MALTYQQLVARARAEITEISTDELAARLDAIPILIDIREPDELALGTIPGSLIIPRGNLEGAIQSRVPDPSTEVVLHCAVGARSALAAKALQDMGYGNVKSLAGGIERWRAEDRSITTGPGLSPEQRVRYARHLRLPEVGEAGQQKLLEAKVAVIGAGGLGSPALLYLGAAGVGTLGVVDFDVVDPSNLQRQILHNAERIGRPKVDSARQTIAAINPDVRVETHPQRLTAANALDVLVGYDIIVDGTDNFPTRYLVNDASLHLRTPVVHGSIFRFEGQATVFRPYAGPCYRCLFAEPPPPELAPSCAEAGVLGVLPGIVGSIQAMEAIKLILGVGDPLVGKLLTYDALDESFHTLRLRRNPECPACADEAHPPVLFDYDETCAPLAVAGEPRAVLAPGS